MRYGFQYPLPTKKTLLSHCPPLKTEQLKIKGFSVKLIPTLPSARCFVSVGGNLYIEVYFFIGCPHIRSSCFIAIWIWGPNIVDVQTWYHRYIAPTFYIETSGRVMPYTFKPYDQNLNSNLLPLFISYRSIGEKLIKCKSKFILFDHVHNSHDHPVLQSIDITRRTLTLITLWAPHLFGALALFSRALTFIIVPLFLLGNGWTEQLKITPQRKTNSYPLLDVMFPLGEICTLTFTSSLGVIIFDSRAL